MIDCCIQSSICDFRNMRYITVSSGHAVFTNQEKGHSSDFVKKYSEILEKIKSVIYIISYDT